MALRLDPAQANKINKILETMDYGNSNDSDSLVKDWLAEHKEKAFGTFVNNEFVDIESCPTIELINPSTGEKLISLYNPSNHTFDLNTVQTDYWGALSQHDRAKLLYKIARNIQKHQRLFSLVESVSTGRHISSTSNIDIPNLIRCVYQSASIAQLNIESNEGFLLVICYEAPSALISLCWRFLPLFAIGHQLILSVAPDCCLSAFLFADICRASGLPNGALTVQISNPETNLLLTQNTVKYFKIFVQGENSLGQLITRTAAQSLTPVECAVNKRLTAIVLENSDQQSAVDGILNASHSGIGTRHGCRVLVQESIFKQFVDSIKQRFSSLRIGLWNDKCADLTACITESDKVDELLKAIKEAEIESANVTRSEKSSPVYLMHEVQTSSAIVQTQTKGIVIVVLPFRTTKESIALANSSPGCHSISVWSESLTVALQVAKSIEANSVWINGNNYYDDPAIETNLAMNYYKGKIIKLKADFGASSCCKTLTFPATLQSNEVDKTYKLYYGGKQNRPDSNTSYSVLDRDGKLIAYAPEGSKKDLRNAVEAANSAFHGWKDRSGHNKAQLLFYLAENLEQRKREFSTLLMKMMGKTREQSELEVDESIQTLFKHASMADKKAGEVMNTTLSGLSLSLREPLGVMGVVCSEDHPLLSFINLAIGASVWGNTVVAIVSQKYPLAALNMYQVLDTSDWPAGVINILSGNTDHLTKVLAEHKAVNGVWLFTPEPVKKSFVMSNSFDKAVWIGQESIENDSIKQMVNATKLKRIYMPCGDSFAN